MWQSVVLNHLTPQKREREKVAALAGLPIARVVVVVVVVVVVLVVAAASGGTAAAGIAVNPFPPQMQLVRTVAR